VCAFEEITSYKLVEQHSQKSIADKWPLRLDFEIKGSKRNPSVYFDTKDKCDKWLKAVDWILADQQQKDRQAQQKEYASVRSLLHPTAEPRIT
jgi:hypothetical protein